MRLSTILPFVSVLVPGVLAYPSQASANASLDARTFGSSIGGSWQTCTRVSGSFGWLQWDFGCLCNSDVEEFCRINHIQSGVKLAIYSHISTYGVKSYFPHNSQPTCDGRGGYTCGSLSKKPDGSCGTTTCDNNHWTSNGGCCPRGQKYVNGRCCGMVGCGNKQGQCYPVYTCPSGQEFKTTTCCKKYLSEGGDGKCSCPWGYEDTGSSCRPKCNQGEKYDEPSRRCVPQCDTSNGWWPQKCRNNGPTICCRRGHIAFTSVCCPSGKEEIGSTGICCTAGVGAKVENGLCIEPTGQPRNPKPKRQQIQLGPSPKIPYGLEANVDGALCPAKLAACPIDTSGLDTGAYECLNPMAELQSCGGCTTLGTGRDCTAIPGAKWMGCNAGQCEVYSCLKGWRLRVGGVGCERRRGVGL